VKRYSIVMPGEGTNYDWSRDHTYVKVSTADTGGAYVLMEDNLKLEFSLGLHLHRHHAETFYVLDGSIDFYIDGDWTAAPVGTTVHIPPGIPHALALTGNETAKVLMIMQPSGFDQYLEILAGLSSEELADEKRMEELSVKFDIISLGDVPPRA
jgi:quercetin dioxygenase-like cupin family protein